MTDADLIADLLATYPGIHARPATEYGRPEYQDGVWIGGESSMPDGLSIFCALACSDPDHYNGAVYHAFEAWIEARGSAWRALGVRSRSSCGRRRRPHRRQPRDRVLRLQPLQGIETS